MVFGAAIVIACTGLLGLISFSIEQRTKEIGIRKVLGSSVLQVLMLLNREFIVPISLAMLIGLPTAYFIMNEWLEDFAIRTSIHWHWFVLVVLLSSSLALITTSLKTLKVARVNPVDSLRNE